MSLIMLPNPNNKLISNNYKRYTAITVNIKFIIILIFNIFTINNDLKFIKFWSFIIVVKTFECEKGYSHTISRVSKHIPNDGMTLRAFLS